MKMLSRALLVLAVCGSGQFAVAQGYPSKPISNGSDPLTMTPEEFGRFLRAGIEMWGRVVKAAGVKIE